jgi:hypothetical protein
LGWKPISQNGGNVNVKADVLSQINNLTAVQQAQLAQGLPFNV